jgi:hypothetical protein
MKGFITREEAQREFLKGNPVRLVYSFTDPTDIDSAEGLIGFIYRDETGQPVFASGESAFNHLFGGDGEDDGDEKCWEVLSLPITMRYLELVHGCLSDLRVILQDVFATEDFSSLKRLSNYVDAIGIGCRNKHKETKK